MNLLKRNLRTQSWATIGWAMGLEGVGGESERSQKTVCEILKEFKNFKEHRKEKYTGCFYLFIFGVTTELESPQMIEYKLYH